MNKEFIQVNLTFQVSETLKQGEEANSGLTRYTWKEK